MVSSNNTDKTSSNQCLVITPFLNNESTCKKSQEDGIAK